MLKVAGGGGAAVGAVVYIGTWDASTNTPTLTSSVGTKGNYYVVSVAGNTDLNGITDWVAGDWAIFNGSVWEKVDNTEAVISVNGQTGVVVLDAANVGAVANTTFVNATGLLTGGGQLTGNVAIDLTSVPIANVTGGVANTVEIIAGTGLAGGGNLAANVTLDLANTSVVPATYGGGSNAAEVTVDAQGRITAAANVAIPQGTVTNVATGVGLTGGPITSMGTIDLANTTVVAGTYGDAANVAQVTVDDQGRLTAAANVAISISTANVTGLGTMATQDANNVAITGGTVNVADIEASNVTVTANLYANLATANTAAMPDPSLPLNPEGYVEIVVNGTTKKIPYYGV